MTWAGKKVRVAKVGATEAPHSRTPSWDEYTPGEEHPGMSTPLNYWLEGVVLRPPKVGERLFISRTNRNGVEIDGTFSSSTVTALEPVNDRQLRVITLNSVYMVAALP